MLAASLVIIIAFAIVFPVVQFTVVRKYPFFADKKPEQLQGIVHDIVEHSSDEFVPSMHLYGVGTMLWVCCIQSLY